MKPYYYWEYKNLSISLFMLREEWVKPYLHICREKDCIYSFTLGPLMVVWVK